MYCPQCATQNVDDVKFCRVCGTALESVALALSGKSPKPVKGGKNKVEAKTAQDWLEKRIEAGSGITRGTILLLVSALIGVAMGFFMPPNFDAPWIVVWSVFFGWMAVWGGIEVAFGISGVIEAKARLRLIELTGEKPPMESVPPPALSGAEPIPATVFDSRPRRSVTEGTTRQLDDHLDK